MVTSHTKPMQLCDCKLPYVVRRGHLDQENQLSQRGSARPSQVQPRPPRAHTIPAREPTCGCAGLLS